jgi:hypothetical protein
VRSDRSEEFAGGGADLALGGEGIQTKLDCLIEGRAVTLFGKGAKEIPVFGLVLTSAARRKMRSPGVSGKHSYVALFGIKAHSQREGMENDMFERKLLPRCSETRV